MVGSGSNRGRATTVLVFEFVTGGGLVGQPLLPSWAAEGEAMRRAIVADFAAVPGVRVIEMRDARFPVDLPLPGVETRIITDRPTEAFEALARGADWVLAIAPETDGLLADHARTLRRIGARSLGSEPEAIELVADKARLADHFETHGIPTPPTRVIVPARGLPDDPGPLVVKPIDGAGSIGTFVVGHPRRFPPSLLGRPAVLVQPYIAGEPRSASYLIDRDGRPRLLGVGRQRMEVGADGKISYHGGTIPIEPDGDLIVVERALASVAGLRGFVGVDFLRDPARFGAVVPSGGASGWSDLRSSGTLILEINPRPTTSFVGLARWLGGGSIASAWLAATEGRPSPLLAPTCPSISFDADGSIRPGASSR